MPLEYSYNPRYVDKDLSKISYGWKNNQSDITELIELIEQGVGYCGGIIIDENNKKPSKANIKYSELLCLDFDNESGHYFSIEDAINDNFIKKYGLLLHPTIRNTESTNRFRVIFQLDQKLSQNDYEIIAEYLIKRYESDPACKDFSKVYAGNSKAKVIKLGGELINTQEFIELAKNNYENEYQNLKGSGLTEIEIPMAEEMLSKIPQKMSYEYWYAVCKDLLDYFGQAQAIRLINNWSPCLDQTGKNITENWIKSIRENRIDFPKTLYSVARNNGWQHKSFILPPKQTKEGKSPAQQTNKIPKNTYTLLVCEDYLKNIGEFRWNVVRLKVEFKAKGTNIFVPLNDRHLNTFASEILKLNLEINQISGNILFQILYSNFAPEYDPFIAYFDSLPEWDGIDRIREVSQCLPVNEYDEMTKIDYLTRWLVGMYAQSTLRGQNHLCFSLVGEQGIGKDTFFKNLLPNFLLDYYVTKIIDPTNPDDIRIVCSNFLVMISELESFSKKDMGLTKQMLTSEEFQLRLPYDRIIQTLKRRSSFCGAVNRAEFLNDPTGSRRFLVLDIIGKIDYENVGDINKEQLYSQIKYLFDQGYQYWYSDEEITDLNKRNQQYNISSPIEELIDEYFAPAKKDESSALFWSSTQISMYILNKVQSKINISPIHLGRNLQNLGFIKTTNNSRYGYWVKLKQDFGIEQENSKFFSKN